jgi:hypothetical protein
MRGIWLWATALALYAAFAVWYEGLGGPLRRDEIEEYLQRFQAASQVDAQRLAAVRAFLESDDGDEFFMVNLIRLHPGPVTDPGSGTRRPAAEVLEGYLRHFTRALVARAGHPAFVARAAGGYLEHWGVEPDPGWSLAGVIRYRSRRDLMEIATDPAFEPAHAYKIAAMPGTLGFPATPTLFFVGPRLWVAMLLALLAAGAHAALLQRRLRAVLHPAR